MFTLKIAGRTVLASKFFAAADREAVLAAIPEGTRRVVFIDTPATAELAPTIEALLGRGVECHVRDHHDEPTPANPRAKQIAEAAERIRTLCGGNAVISNRKANPACSGLIEVGQFAEEGTVIVADPDPDGLTASMKAAGVFYAELDSDADVLDGGRAGQTVAAPRRSSSEISSRSSRGTRMPRLASRRGSRCTRPASRRPSGSPRS
jgi:hypothetical protein